MGRKFDEALKALPESQKRKKVKVSEGIHFCDQLYSNERNLKHVKPYKHRLERSRHILVLFQHGLMNRKIVFYQKVS
ncbi:hypothetical protein [Bacillus sp. AFS051223]|uniref:hypothetical protein n=1 Tax=Bacillus sp. AFS051223 TaxID=2034280 RepID=UPI00359C4A17